MLGDISVFTSNLSTHKLDFVYYDTAINQVYNSGPLRTSLLRESRAPGFNSGRWASRRGLFSIEEFENRAIEMLRTREQFNARNTDQAFINYCCDSKAIGSARR